MSATVYVVVQSEWKSGDVAGCLLLETGEVLWNHMSSDRWWLQRDLTDGFSDRRDELVRRFPDGYGVVLVDGDGVIPADVLARNREWSVQTATERSETAAANPGEGRTDGG